MAKLIKDWEDLSKVLPNDKYRIIVDKDMCSGWIVPIYDYQDDEDDFKCNCSKEIKNDTKKYFEKHVYLSTHTFYNSSYKMYTRVLQNHGFDVEIDNWDK